MPEMQDDPDAAVVKAAAGPLAMLTLTSNKIYKKGFDTKQWNDCLPNWLANIMAESEEELNKAEEVEDEQPTDHPLWLLRLSEASARLQGGGPARCGAKDIGQEEAEHKTM